MFSDDAVTSYNAMIGELMQVSPERSDGEIYTGISNKLCKFLEKYNKTNSTASKSVKHNYTFKNNTSIYLFSYIKAHKI